MQFKYDKSKEKSHQNVFKELMKTKIKPAKYQEEKEKRVLLSKKQQ